MDLLDVMMGHDAWTTTRLLEMSRELEDSQLDREFDVGHRTLRATFEHMVFSMEVWAAAMADQSMDPSGDDHSLATLAERQDRSYQEFATCARRINAERRLEETFLDPWTDFPTPRPYGSTIVHVILHNQQHRSEVLHILERLGVDDLPEGDPFEWERDR